MLNILRNIIPERSSLRLTYHKIMAILAVIFYRFPAHRLTVIGVTGTSGKSTTVELIHYLLQGAGKKCGAISTLNFHIGEKESLNETLRTTLSPWQTQKLLRKMVAQDCEYVVLEVSSHAIDQSRLWGVPIDTALLVNISDNEHLDYHKNFAEYVRTKAKLFRTLNFSHRKPGIEKISILNRDDEQFEIFDDFPADKKWTFSTRKPSDIKAYDVKLSAQKTTFTVHLPNHKMPVEVALLGQHNVENLTAAITVATSHGVGHELIEPLLKKFKGIPGRLETVNVGQDFSVVVDFSYKPSALKAVLATLKSMVTGRIIVVFGGAYGRTEANLNECGSLLNELADEIVLTTDDPNDDDPKRIAKAIAKGINRTEGQNYFEIEDRYEAIRYALFSAEKGDCVLIAGRGHEKIQTIGSQKIPFDDKAVAQEILTFRIEDAC